MPITIDLTYLYSVTGGDKLFEQMLLTEALADIDIQVKGLKHSWEKKDAGTIKRNAHSLISLSAIAGICAIESWSRIIDQVFSDGLFHPELYGLVDNIFYEWPAAKSQLVKILNTQGLHAQNRVEIQQHKN